MPFEHSPALPITRRNVVPLALGLTVLAGIGDYVTSIDVTFTLAYVVPLALGTWFRSRAFGIALALLATATGVLTAVGGGPEGGHAHSIPTLIWNNAGAFGLFILLVWTLDRLRAYVDAEREGRRVAVEQLRHGDRLQVIGKLAAGVAHELGTPLNVISGHAEMLVEPGRTPERIDDSARVILAYSRRMTALIRQLLDFGRRGGSAKGTVNLGELTASATKLLVHTASKAQCELKVSSAGTVSVLANATELAQVITNLVMNAIQAMPKGGVVRVLTHADEAGLACVSIEDEGVGISEADLAQVFDPFFTTKGIGEGTGLGLSVSYGIVQDHGGRIDVRSAPGEGTRFTIKLPVERV